MSEINLIALRAAADLAVGLGSLKTLKDQATVQINTSVPLFGLSFTNAINIPEANAVIAEITAAIAVEQRVALSTAFIDRLNSKITTMEEQLQQQLAVATGTETTPEG